MPMPRANLARAVKAHLPPGSRAECLPFHRPSIDADDIAGVVETLESGWITTGPVTKRFEEKFAACGRRARTPSPSTRGRPRSTWRSACSASQPGDEVIVPTYTFTATAEVVTLPGRAAGARRRRPGDRQPRRAEDVAAALTPKTRAVVPVHSAGLPCEMAPLRELADGADLRILEDAAHAFPAREGQQPVGTLGDAAAFSFYATKNITTGEGGMLVTARPRGGRAGAHLALHGISRDAWKRYTAEGTWRYEVLASGYKYNLTDIASSLGLAAARASCGRSTRGDRPSPRATRARSRRLRRDRARRPTRAGIEHAWHLYVIRLRPERAAARPRGRSSRSCARGTSARASTSSRSTCIPYYQQVWGYRPGRLPARRGALRAGDQPAALSRACRTPTSTTWSRR